MATTKRKGRKKSPKKSPRAKRPKQALTADRHALYQKAVQSPEADIEFLVKEFKAIRKRAPMSIREDFCGTAHLATAWAKSHRERTAVGVDLCGETLAWGREHNLEPAGPKVQARVKLIEGDVLEKRKSNVDIVAAMNFSYCVFKSRKILKKYFEAAYAGLKPDGIFVTELFGGTESIIDIVDERECDGFTYVWEQEHFNPIKAEMRCHISFHFADRSKLERAFSYDWRMWTLPEVRELLEEVGFREVRIYWEDVDEDGDGTGEYHRSEDEENQEAWLTYIVAVK